MMQMTMTDEELEVVIDALYRYSNLRKTKHLPAKVVTLGLKFMQELYDRRYLEMVLKRNYCNHIRAN